MVAITITAVVIVWTIGGMIGEDIERIKKENEELHKKLKIK